MTAAAVGGAIRAALFAVAVCGVAEAAAQVPAPPGYRLDHYKAPTPANVPGGTALDTPAAHKLWQQGGAVWIDVLAAPKRPANLPAQSVWMPLPRRDIPGSLWLPDVGQGALNPDLERFFRDHLDAATKGRRDMPVVFYCLADCWMSWNAAKRAAGWGYTSVYWYRDGTDGWDAAHLPLVRADPAPGG
ncbi:MAG TPA: PQQ-dependent catabolism-associated CXXCW motif protein [Stellaceae bacterium]|jgi:PQQ-dependent catabolism-associated CXXCW motif protein